MTETVLIVGGTGHIGISGVKAILATGRKALVIVRNDQSAQRLFDYIGSKDNITTVQADIMADDGVQSVVDQVKAGKLPAFQHVFSCSGNDYSPTPLKELTMPGVRLAMKGNFETRVSTYLATVPYLLEQNYAGSSWTLATGAQGDLGFFAQPAMTQGALFSMAIAASRELADTNIRFNEFYIALRVEEDSSAAKTGAMSSTTFAKGWENVLNATTIRGSKIIVRNEDDLSTVVSEPKYKD